MIGEKWSARFRSHDEIRSRGAIGNLNDGIEITTQGVRTRLIAWPGNGFQTESVHVLTLAPGEESARYEYDMSDEAIVCFKGQGEVYLRGCVGHGAYNRNWVYQRAFDCGNADTGGDGDKELVRLQDIPDLNQDARDGLGLHCEDDNV